MGLSVNTDILVIGGGLAGLAAALSAKANWPSARVCLCEKNDRPGRKFLLAGSGQCNITHAGNIRDFFTRYGAHGRFVQPALLEYPNTELIEFIESNGVPLEEWENGKIFPVSRKGIDILNLFVNRCRELGVRFVLSSPVSQVKYDESKTFFVSTDTACFTTQKLIMATGGISYPRTGSTGDGLTWAKSLGHAITPLYPGLAGVRVKEWCYADCAGISLKTPRLTLFRNNAKIGVFEGEILLTHEGLSGPGILDISRYIRVGDRLELALTEHVLLEELDQILLERITENPTKQISSIIRELGVPARLGRSICQNSQVSETLCGSVCDRATRRKIASLLVAWPCVVKSLEGFDRAMVTAGGVELSGVDRKTMESRHKSGLFFAGEVLDIDGDTGGFNLQFAWSSGMLAGRVAAQSPDH
ncbi:MAG: NAD(P)/FAD-dependent oxidoreductase [Thermoguttaceae bacterium]|nr:NAD(P)/FAD-dependent oxidoreductase [Thermoguttaceae bacterium]